MTADIDREKLRELCDRATPGPWVSEGRATGKSPDAGCGVIASNDDLVISNPSRGITAWACRLVGMTNAECEANSAFIAASRTAIPALLDLTDAQAAKTAELEAENASLRERADAPEDRTWFWEIVDRDGLANVASDERQALADICRAAAERDQLRKQGDGQFIAGLRQAVNIINGIEIWDSPDADVRGDAFDTACDAILSAASALEQKEQG